MPNGILHGSNTSNDAPHFKQNLYNNHDDKSMNGTLRKNPDKGAKQDGLQKQQQQPSSILNVAEMLLHGVADHEILDRWLRSISCEEFIKNFLDAGYDMPTISRVTPQDLTAIGVIDPTKRSKILGEIKKLNLQDGIPGFRPAGLSHWFALLRLDDKYYKSLCDQNIDTIDKVCQLTWEDFEELGITRLGHQKRLQLAIERIKELDNAELKTSSKPISEPIYDTNSSQILLVASSENHSMNGPIINKQSSTSELSSTGSGSMHSIYSSSSHHQLTSQHAVHQNNSNDTNGKQNQQSLSNQAIYSQPPSQLFQQQQQQKHQLQATNMLQTHQSSLNQTPPLPPINSIQHRQTNHLNGNITPTHNNNNNNNNNQTVSHTTQSFSHYQAAQTQPNGLKLVDDCNIRRTYGNSNNKFNNDNVVPSKQQIYQTNRQSLGQLPYVLANLPKHQQQLLQQSSIYATLSRQPQQRVKQPPPPVPIRTNSLKSNSLIDEDDNRQRNEQFFLNQMNNNTNSALCSSQHHQQQQQHQFASSGESSHSTVSANSLYRTGPRVTSRSQFNTQLHKNKSFSGNAYMDAARARFLQRNNSQVQSQQPVAQQMQQLHQQLYAASNLTQHARNLTNGSTSLSSGAAGYVAQATSAANPTTAGDYYAQQHDIYGMNTRLLTRLASITSDQSNVKPPDSNLTPTGLMSSGSSSIMSNGDKLSNVTTGRDDDFPPPPSPLSLTDYDAGQTISELA